MTNQEIFDLITRFEHSTIHTMKLARGDFSLELSKAAGAAVSCAVPVSIETLSTPAAAAPMQDAPVITAPLVGTYYAASVPDAEPFVSVGDKVKKGDTVCLIEAMKMISEIPAPCDCVITEILQENGSLVAFNQPIFRYQPC